MCADGSKLVVLITGICSTNCFYCPLSKEKMGKDRIFANEWELENEDSIDVLFKEAEYIDATGAGITGGDPLIVWQRTKRYIEVLKQRFGSDFNIHLYTSGLKNHSHISDLITAGLDEIRFHPQYKYWNNMDNSPIKKTIKETIKSDVDVTIEIPIIPDMKNQIFSLIKWSSDNGIKFINLNELEFSETNAESLNKKRFFVKDSISAAVNGSQELAIKILEKISDKDLDVGLHYCSSSFKDGIQLKNRLKRRAQNISKPYEVITNEGTILKGIIPLKDFSYSQLKKSITKEFNISKDKIYFNKKKNRLELPIWILEKFVKELKKRGLECYIVEEYPTADGLEVERIPLPI
jgi:pyruvate formate-lyase activating enzyme-like uncharacterized protein